MEFYFAFLRFLVPIIGFNSQRDGILRYSGKNLEMRMSVSIPNGMEFYSLLSILVCMLLRVSIPNGMEFYQTLLYLFISRIDVSIPNGMEFYNEKDNFSSGSVVFQFPTGWNSTLLYWVFPVFALYVSIPNGMEFYRNMPALAPL